MGNDQLTIKEFAAIGVFIICSIIDFIRQKLIEMPFIKWLDRVINCATNKLFKKS